MRGFGILKRYCPGLAQGKALYELINSIQPFISVWFSARIINEICTQRRAATVAIYVIGVVLTNFVCSILKSILDRVGKCKNPAHAAGGGRKPLYVW